MGGKSEEDEGSDDESTTSISDWKFSCRTYVRKGGEYVYKFNYIHIFSFSFMLISNQYLSSSIILTKDISSGFRGDVDNFLFGRAFLGPPADLDRENKLELRGIYKEHRVTAADVGQYVTKAYGEVRRYEKLFLKSEDQNNFTHSVTTTSHAKPRTQKTKYPTAFSDALVRWNAGGRITPLALRISLFNDAQKLIKANKGSTEPNVRSVKLGVTRVITSKAKSDAAYSQLRQEGDGLVARTEAFTNQMLEDMKDVFDGTIPVRLFEAINDDKGFDGAQLSFNLQITDPSNFHGFTIHSGAGYLADKLLEKYYVADDQTSWSVFLKILRRYGVKDDICNAGTAQRVGLGDLNERKFIFYHEHFHKGGLNELEKVAQSMKKVYRD